jgi:hypothetical protein
MFAEFTKNRERFDYKKNSKETDFVGEFAKES